MSFASNAGINGLMGMMNFYQLPDSYLSDYLTRVDKVDLAGVNTALRQKINPDKFLIVTVGDQTALDSNDSNQATNAAKAANINKDRSVDRAPVLDKEGVASKDSSSNITEKRTIKPVQ